MTPRTKEKLEGAGATKPVEESRPARSSEKTAKLRRPPGGELNLRLMSTGMHPRYIPAKDNRTNQ